MGIYTGAMYFPKETAFPIIVPKLGVAVYWHEPFEGYANEITFRTTFVDMDADPSSEDGQLLTEARYNLKEMSRLRPLQEDASPNRLAMLTAYMMVSPFTVPHPGKVRVRAVRDDQLIAVGAMRVEPAPN